LPIADDENTWYTLESLLSRCRTHLLLEFLDASLQLLDLLLQLADQRLFILKLGSQRRELLVLALDGLFEFLLVPLEIGDGFLRELQIALYLPLRLLYVGTANLTSHINFDVAIFMYLIWETVIQDSPLDLS
jgi:hypothetical protein